MLILRRVVRAVRTVTVSVALTGLAVLAVALIVLPKATGWVPVTVLTSSMEPTIPTGSQVVLERVDGEDDASRLRVGDVVAFMPYPHDPALVIHRIATKTTTSGGVAFTTQGDARTHADDWTITATQLRGVVRYHVPYAGYVANAVDADLKRAATVTILGALGVYMAWQCVTEVRARRRALPETGSNSEWTG